MKFSANIAVFALMFCLFLSARPGCASTLSQEPVSLDELAEVLPEIKAGLESVRLRKNPQLLNNNTFAATSLPRLSLLDAKLEGGKLDNVYLPELHARNLVLKNFRFADCRITGAVFENVSFVNCVFDGTFISSSSFSDCRFDNCAFIHKYTASDQHDFDKNTFKNVTIDRGSFKNSFTLTNCEGQLTLLNVTDAEGVPSIGRFLIHGLGLRLRVENSSIGDIDFIQTWRGSEVEVLNSRFAGSRFWMGESGLSFRDSFFDKDVSLSVDGSVILNNCTAPAAFEKGARTILKVNGGNVKTD